MTTSERGVRLRAVVAGYSGIRRIRVLDDVSLDAVPGQITALVGPNGVGKTTLFRVLGGFLKPWAGEAFIDGMRPRDNRRSRGIAYLPESVALPAGYTVAGLLQVGARLAGLRGTEAASAIEDVLDSVGLSDSAHRALTGVSKGTGRRAALAYALLGSPNLVLLDEPMSGLDPRARAGLRETVERLRGREATVVVASHDLLDVQRSADVAFVLDRGRIVRRIEGSDLAAADLERIVLDAGPAP